MTDELEARKQAQQADVVRQATEDMKRRIREFTEATAAHEAVDEELIHAVASLER
jgi:bisphosphoglycerate-independent phosphoglycerate mutase (AlkP superfamily)